MKKFFKGALVLVILGAVLTILYTHTINKTTRSNKTILTAHSINKILFHDFTPAGMSTNLLHLKNRGTLSERPIGVVQGFVYFDTTLNKPIYWNGKGWVDSSVINLKDFGAKGDGISDDTNVIQNALNLARDYGKVELYFPNGVYNTKQLRLYKNTNLTLNQNATIKRIGTGNILFSNGKSGDKNYAANYHGEGNFHVNGGTIDLNTDNAPIPNYKGTIAFNVAHADNVSFKNLKIINGQNGHYFQVSSSKNVVFDGCWFGNVRYTNPDSKDYELIQIEEATKISFPTFGGYDGTVSKNITIQNSHFENVIRAVGTHSYSRDKDGITPLRYCKNIVIRNNVFKNSISEFGHFEAFKHVTIEDNIFEDSGAHPIYFYHSSDNIVKNNYIIGSKKSGLKLTAADANVIENNTFLDTCKISSAPCNPIIGVDSNRNKIINNNIENTEHEPTLKLTKSKDNKIENNQKIIDPDTKEKILNLAKSKTTKGIPN